jgi:tetratricopeptide (TPR) repeat protein
MEEPWKEVENLPFDIPGTAQVAVPNVVGLTQAAATTATTEPLLARATAAMPQDFNSWYLLGLVRQRLERREDALRAWRSALQIQPNNLKLMQVMAVEFSQGRYFLEAADIATQPEAAFLSFRHAGRMCPPGGAAAAA